MLRRLLYHSFWNFYDHLGIYALVGIMHALISLGIVAIITQVSISGFTSVWLLFAGLSIPAAIAMAALLPFSARAARGEPVRWPTLWQSLKLHLAPIGILTAGANLCMIILLVNLRFYLMMQSQSSPYLFTVLAALDGWLIVLICFLFWPMLCALSLPGPVVSLRARLYQPFVWIVILPSVWLFIGITGTILLWAAFVTRFGLLVYLPIMIVLAQSAAFLSTQYIEFLSIASRDSTKKSGIRHLKNQAMELAIEWEANQPRRTLRELIKPWEM